MHSAQTPSSAGLPSTRRNELSSPPNKWRVVEGWEWVEGGRRTAGVCIHLHCSYAGSLRGNTCRTLSKRRATCEAPVPFTSMLPRLSHSAWPAFRSWTHSSQIRQIRPGCAGYHMLPFFDSVCEALTHFMKQTRLRCAIGNRR